VLIYQKTLQRYYFYFEKANFSKDFYFRKVIFAYFFTFAKVNRSNPLCQRSFRSLLKYRTIVLYLLYPFIRVGRNYLFCILSFV